MECDAVSTAFSPSLPSPFWAKRREEPIIHFDIVAPDNPGAPARPDHLCINLGGALAKCPSGAVSDDDDYVTIVEAARELETSQHIVKQAILDFGLKPKAIRYRRVYYFPEIEDALAKGAYPLSWVLCNDFIGLAHITHGSWDYVVKAGLAPEGRMFDGKMFYDPERAAEVTHASYTLSAQRAEAARESKRHAYHPPPLRPRRREDRIPATPSAYTLAEERGLLRIGQVATALGIDRKQAERDAAAGVLPLTELVLRVRFFSQESVALYAKRLTGHTIYGASRRLKCDPKTIRRLMAEGQLAFERFNYHRVVIDCESLEALAKDGICPKKRGPSGRGKR